VELKAKTNKQEKLLENLFFISSSKTKFSPWLSLLFPSKREKEISILHHLFFIFSSSICLVGRGAYQEVNLMLINHFFQQVPFVKLKTFIFNRKRASWHFVFYSQS